jgi:hypothetical protein
MLTSIQTINDCKRIFHHAQFAANPCEPISLGKIDRIIHHAPRFLPQMVIYSLCSAIPLNRLKPCSATLSVPQTIRTTPDFITTGLLPLVKKLVRLLLANLASRVPPADASNSSHSR